MKPGDTVVLRATEEHVLVVAVLDASGTCLVRSAGDEFTAARDELEPTWAKHAGCGCCS